MQNEHTPTSGEALQSLNQELEERVHQLTKDLREAEERLRFIGIDMDITEHKRDETALSKSHEQLRLMIEQAPVGIAMLDRNMCYLAASFRWKEDFSREDQDLSGRSHYEVFPDITERWKEVYQKALAGEIIKNNEDEWIQADNSKVWLRWAVHPWRDAYDEIGGIIMSAENITPRKQAEVQVRESEQRLQAIVENLTEGLIIADFDGHLGQWNRAALEMHGFRNLSEATLRVAEMEKIFELATLEGRTLSSAERPLARIIRGEALRNYEVRIRRKGSDWERIFKYNGNSLVEPGGKPIAILTITDITDRKQAEESLRQSEKHFRALFEAGGVGHVECEAQTGRFLRVNQKMCEITGYSAEELQERTFAEITHPEDQYHLAGKYQQFIAGETPEYKIEKRYVRKDHSIVWVGITSSLLLDQEGHPWHTVAVIQDITDRKQVEERLRESEARFRIMADGTPVIIWVTDTEGRVEFINRACREFFGITLEAVQTESWLPLVHPDDVTNYVAAFLAAHRAHTSLHVVARVRRHDGEWRWIESDGEPRFSTSGAFLGMAGSSPDITARKRIELALRASEERLKLALNASRMGVWEWNVHTNAVFWSPECYEMLGDENFDETWEAFAKLIHPEDQERVRQAVQHSIVDQGIFSAEFRVTRPNGETLWLLNRGRAQYNEQEEPLRMVGIIQDITQRKLAEAELEQSLEQVRYLATHLQDVREEERKRIARELHDELGQALAGLKFDLAWLENHLLPDDAPSVQLFQEKTQTMSKIIDATIQIGRKIATELRPRVLDDLGLVAALEWQARDFQKRTGITCEFLLLGADITLDAGRATAAFRICQETLTNILRHAQATTVTIHLQVENNCLRLEIKDNGRGITEQEINRNVSLGLLGMKERLLPYGGKIDIQGRVGKGTTITVLLPLVT